MRANENWMDQVKEGIAQKELELKQVLLANQLHTELEEMSLEKVLTNHLPATDAGRLASDAQQLHQGVDEMYQSLNTQVEGDQLEAVLNETLGNRSQNDQGKYLVNLIRCFSISNQNNVIDDPRWDKLSVTETFSQEDVSALINIVKKEFSDAAGFIARQEFQIMDNFMKKYNKADVEMRVNSGKRYAEAYAASMYIISKQTSGIPVYTPHQMGLIAAKSVESCKLLAMYHEGKIRLDELGPKLQMLAKNMMALAIRMMMSDIMYQVGKSILVTLAVTNTTAMWVVPVCLAVAGFFALNQSEAVDFVTDTWESIKSVFRWAAQHFFGTDDPSYTANEATDHQVSTNVGVSADTSLVTA